MFIREWELTFPNVDDLTNTVNTIRNLVTFFDCENMLATEVDAEVGCRVACKVYGHDKYPAGCGIKTSPIVRIERKPYGDDGTGFVFITQSGSRYNFSSSEIGLVTEITFKDWRNSGRIRLSPCMFY